MNENPFSHKSPEELSQQVQDAEHILGDEPLLTDDLEKQNYLDRYQSENKTDLTRELRDTYPRRYSAYIAALKSLKHQNNENESQLEIHQSRLQAVNRLENTVNLLGTEDQDVALRDYQYDVFKDLLSFFESDKNIGYIKLPTGYGKTVVFVSLIKTTGMRTIILVPTLDLVNQTIDRISQFAPDINVAEYTGEHKDHLDSQVIVSTYDSANNLEKLLSETDINHDLIICDEAHRNLTEKRIDVLDRFAKDKIVIGLTATPEFDPTNKSADITFENLIHETSLVEAIQEGYLAPARCVFIKTNFDISQVSVNPASGQLNPDELEKILDQEQRNQAALQILKNPEFSDKGAVAFCLSIGHAQRLAKLANDNNISAVAVWGEMPKEDREQAFKDYEEGKYQLICGVALLREGWDSPRAKVGLYLSPTLSQINAEQRGGRTERLYQDQIAWHFDFVDIGTHGGDVRHGITMVDVLNGNTSVPRSKDGENANTSNPSFDIFNGVKIEGIEVITDEQEILAINDLGKIENTESILSDKASYLRYLEKATKRSPQEIASYGESSFLTWRIITDDLSITGQRMISKYCREVNPALELKKSGSIPVSLVRAFWIDLYGPEFEEIILIHGKAQHATAEDLSRFLEMIISTDREDILEEKINIGFGSKLPLTGSQLLRGLAMHSKFKDKFKDREMRVDDYQSVRAIAEYALKPEDLKSYMDAWRSWFKVDDKESSEELSKGGRRIPAITLDEKMEGLTVQLSRYISEHTSEYYFVPFKDFLKKEFTYRKNTMTGLELMQMRGYDITHTDYKEFINEMSGRYANKNDRDICKEFWPHNRELVRNIVIESLSNARKDSVDSEGNIIWPSADRFAQLPIYSNYLSKNKAQTFKIGRRLLAIWNGSKNFKDADLEYLERNPSPDELEDVYESFKEFLS